MALTVEDGTGLAAAESYASVDFADTYHTAYGAPTAWSGATTSAKETALREATRYIDAEFGKLWSGQRANETQALDWPRLDVIDRDGYTLDANALPVKLKQATAILALESISGDLYPNISSGDGTLKASMVKVGPITIDNEFVGGAEPFATYRIVRDMLSAYTTGKRLYRS